ncbi:hypothetical protein JMJ11_001704 [Salmonella enterica]|nr:hypothetical protein [Salmonella enterica]EFQ7270420.1 hypothetical protein [Salmonella enterica]EFR0215482.1 hypothetical protein [Salmonella enterica]EFR3645629.1 hypothetical protein [Salmonella enterica]EFT4101255.1 hypothetical protein [Salmonella enterica]
MQITKEQVKSWHACTDGFRWFLDKFPQGGAYADVHGALIADKRFDDARWLVDKMYRTHLDKAEFIQAETAATDKMVGELTSSGDDARIGSSGDDARIGSSGYNAQIGSSGDDARIGSSGYNARITASGKNSVVACAGSIERIVLGENGCTSVPWHDGKRIRIAVAYVGENGIEANTPYYVNDEGQFVKVEE